MIKRRVVSGVVGGVLALGGTWAWAAGQRARLVTPGLTSWVVYWDPEESLRAFEGHASWLEEIAVFAYHFDERGRLVPATPWVSDALQTLTARARDHPTPYDVVGDDLSSRGTRGAASRRSRRGWDHRPRILVTVVNDLVTTAGIKRLKDPQSVHEALVSPEAMAAHIDQLLLVAAGADGIELDYENLLAEDRQALSQLVHALAARLHARGQWLSVVVQPKTRDHIRDGAGALDWNAIGQQADMVKVMAYHYHHARASPGPVAPPNWVVEVTRFAQAQIPPQKLCVVLTLQGFDWPVGQEGRSLDYATATRLANTHGVLPHRDEASGAPSFRYEADGTQHEVWFEDTVSLRQTIALLRREGVRVVGLWHLGAGDALVSEALQAARDHRP